MSMRKMAALAAAAAVAFHSVADTNITENVTLVADTDWTSHGTVNLSGGVVVDLNGHDLRVGGLAGEGRFVSSEELIVNGSFEQIEGATGDWQGFATSGYPTAWTGAYGGNVATHGWGASRNSTWSDQLAAQDGNRSVWWWCKDNTSGGATLMQNVNVVKADIYRLSFYTAYRPYGGIHKNMRIHVDVDGNTIGYATCSTATWAESVFDVLLDVGEHSITFRSDGTGGGSNPCALLDNVSLRRRSNLRLGQSADGTYSSQNIAVDEDIVVLAESQTLNGDCDWRALGAVNIAAGATIDMAGHDLAMNGLTYDIAARICESKLVANGSFEQIEGAGTDSQTFSGQIYPTAWTAENVSGSATVGWTPSLGTTWSDKLAARDGSRSVWWWCNDNTCGGATLMQKVNVVKADVYRLSFYTAYRPHGGIHKNMRIHVDVDGNTIGYAVCSTATWAESAFDVLLDAGEHSITFRSDGTGGGGNPCALLDLVSLRFLDAAITNSNEEVVSELHANFASGWTANDKVALGGNLKLVKEGAGTFASHKAQTYTGGTLVAAGTAQPPDPANQNDVATSAKYFPAFGTGPITVAQGAVFDIRANYEYNEGYNAMILDGGTLRNGKWQMTHTDWGGCGIAAITKDSSLQVWYTTVLGRGSGTLDLGTHKLSATMPYGQVLYVTYPAMSNGTFAVSGEGWARFDNACDIDARFEVACPITIAADIRVRDYIVNFGGTASSGGKALNVYGTFMPNTDMFYGCMMLDKSTIDLSGRTTALPAEGVFTELPPSRLSVSFEEGATVTVHVDGRADLRELSRTKENGAFAGYLMKWKAKPDASVKFVLDGDAAQKYRLRSTDGGLVLCPASDFVLLVR